MSIKYLIPFFFLCINIFSQDKVNLKEQCRSQYDSIFKHYFGKEFFTKNIKYDKDRSSIEVLSNDPNNEGQSRIFLNITNNIDIKKYMQEYSNFDYYEYYKYSFLYKKTVFHERTYTCEAVDKKGYSDYENKLILDYYYKIKNKEYLSPKKALKIAKANGLKNICYQSITNVSFHNKNQDVWQIQDCSNEKITKIIELNPNSGKVLTLFDRDYRKNEKASYWNFFIKSK